MERKKQIVLRRIVLFLLLLLPNIYATFRVNDLTLSPVVNSYDNSILYTDYFLDSLITSY